jgi:D-beta-D-heptose 7-phosphate kinase/D-beta-D-heptose 1-phosphate adenosyltransferase
MLTDKIITAADWQQKDRQGQTVVFTNGCFDIIHAGHVQYLEKAAGLGDMLVLGLNSDASVQRLKGSSRPINNQQDRAIVMAAISFVSYIIIFDADTPYDLIQEIQPDILVKGGDWTVDKIVGSDIVLNKGGRVLSLPFWEGLSTTSIIGKLHKENT